MSKTEVDVLFVPMTDKMFEKYAKDHPNVRPFRKKVVIGMQCDICGKVIHSGSKYISANTSHSDWGNDSCESFQSWELCSIECASQLMERYKDVYTKGTNRKTDRIEFEGEGANYTELGEDTNDDS